MYIESFFKRLYKNTLFCLVYKNAEERPLLFVQLVKFLNVLMICITTELKELKMNHWIF